MKKNQLVVLFEELERRTALEHNGKNIEEINKTLAELRQEIDLLIEQNKRKTVALIIHRCLSLLEKIWDYLS
jgi:uncharacterized coiled-coil protein SlyX